MTKRTLIFLLASLFALPVTAQVGRFEVQRFHPATSQSLGYISAESGEARLSEDFEAGLFPHFSFDPLTAEDENGNEHAVISQQLVTHVWLAWSPESFLRLGADMPLYVLQSGDEATLRSAGLDGSGLGDLRLVPKIAVIERPSGDGPALSLIAPLSLPVGDSTVFQGEGFRAEPGVAFDFTSGRTGVAANLGYMLREKTELGDLVLDDQVTYKIAGRYPLAIDLTGILEFNGAVGLGGDLSSEASPLELYAAIRYRIGSSSITAGGGTGIIGGVGTPSARTFIGYAYQPVASSAPMAPLAPPEPVVVTRVVQAPAPTVLDKDGDRILDEADQCPNDPEDMDRFEDEDGCPDLDNDADGVPDLKDTCPMMAEDKDGFEDLDGCPDKDNDRDGVDDINDKCPAESEDVDRFQDEDGCPDLDNDGDGVTDMEDNCPNKAGVASSQGCPKGAASETFPPSLDIVIFFESGSSQLDTSAKAHLGRLMRRLEADASIKRVGIQGHADASSTDDVNSRLSMKRASRVRDYLIGSGVAAERLEIGGYGESRPVEDNGSRTGRQANRRVEFIILERK